jgi:ankyrin repeat protein
MLLGARHRAILDTPDTSGRTALFKAVAEWRIDIARMLLSAGCDTLVPDEHGHTTIYYAVASRNQGLIDAFMNHNQYHKEFLSSALKLGQLWRVDQSLSGHVDTWHTFDGGHTTILHEAAESGFVDVIKFIVQKDKDGVLLDKPNGDGQLPLLLATVAGDPKIVNVLIKAKSNVNGQGRLGNASLHLAARDDLPKVVKVLIKAGTRLDITNSDGETPYTKALACGSDDCAALLANAGG